MCGGCHECANAAGEYHELHLITFCKLEEKCPHCQSEETDVAVVHPSGAAHHGASAALAGHPHLAAVQPGGVDVPEPGGLTAEEEDPH